MLRSPAMRQRMAEQGRAHVLEHFSQEKQVSETSAFYMEALRRPKAVKKGRAHAAGGGRLTDVTKPKAASGPAIQPTPAQAREAEAKFRVGDAVRRWCFQSLGPQLDAVILTGSMARNEATWRASESHVEFLSDAEFILILKPGDLPSQETVTLICSAAEDELRNQGVLCKVSVSAAHESYLAKLGDTIFGLELLECGEVLYGDAAVLAVARRGRIPRVSEEDGWRLLANRTVELLEIVSELSEGTAPLSDAAQYRLTKLYCDMATSLLVFKREFVTGYQARYEKLRHLRQHGSLADMPFDVDWFVEMVRRCTSYKITQAWSGVSPFSSRDSVSQVIAMLRALWAWELAQSNHAWSAAPIAMLRLHMQQQAMKERLRGWAFVARRRGTLETVRSVWRWQRLLRQGSPRYCVYAAALGFWERVRFEDSHIVVEDLEAVREWLPIANPAGGDRHNGLSLAEAILWNYQEFLVETNA